METLKRNSVFVALSGTIGNELVFKHYTNKVVVAKYPDTGKTEPITRQAETRKKYKGR